MIRDIDWFSLTDNFKYARPFNHIIIDNFLIPEIADKVSEEFPEYNSDFLNYHDNPLENKRTCNQWDKFPSCTYRLFSYFGKSEFLQDLQILSQIDGLEYDFGLNGGGWHMHGSGGNNNVHLDYNIHPKLGKQRKLNIIIYLTKDWKPEWGGGLELWDGNEETPNTKQKTVDNVYNRAIIFDTTQNSWHGLPNKISCPETVIRKSIAAYFVIPSPNTTENRGRALFAPREEQKNDTAITELIRKRADINLSNTVYKQ